MATSRIASVQTESIGINAADRKLNPYCPEFDANYVIENIKNPNVEKQCERLELAGKNHTDIVVLTEQSEALGSYSHASDRPEAREKVCSTVPGETTEKYGAIAKKYGMHIVAGVSEKENDIYYNTAVLIGRDGNLIGKYRKVHLTPQERGGLISGNSYPVFETDIGRIGMLVCYDWIFPEAMACLACNGPDLVCLPTHGYGWTEDLGEVTVKCRAADHSVNVAMSMTPGMISTLQFPGRSCIVNRGGQILADAGYSKDTIIYSDLDLKTPRYDRSFPEESISDLGGRLFVGRHPETYRILTEEQPSAYNLHLKQHHVRELYSHQSCIAWVHRRWGYDSSDGKVKS